MRWSTRRLGALVAMALATTFVVIAPIGCDNAYYTYLGRRYDEAKQCLGSKSEVIDVVEGPDLAGVCKAVCLEARNTDGGHFVYVSTMCPPYPPQYQVHEDGVCKEALAADQRGGCYATDGGDAAPDAPLLPDAAAPDANGADAHDAATDTSVDASADVLVDAESGP